MDEAELNDFYSDHFSAEYRGGVLPSGKMLKEMHERAEPRHEFVKANLKLEERAEVLEIGCATGHFLHLMASDGYVCSGIEPDVGFSAYGKKQLGLNVKTEMLNLGEFQTKKYDLICIFHALEHLVDPMEVLNTFHRAIKDNGYLFIEIPDLTAAIRRKRFDPETYFHKAHLYDFTLETIKTYLAKTGFSIIRTAHDAPCPKDKNLLILAAKTTPPVKEMPVKPGGYEALQDYFVNEYGGRRHHPTQNILKRVIRKSPGGEALLRVLRDLMPSR
ncbi:MAG: class I SAM-dependent methyltransferase [Thermodesulfobacteriota bacterium]